MIHFRRSSSWSTLGRYAAGLSCRRRLGHRFPAPDQLKFFVLAKGRCWMRVEGMGEALRMNEGDVVLTAARGFVVAAAPIWFPVLHLTFSARQPAGFTLQEAAMMSCFSAGTSILPRATAACSSKACPNWSISGAIVQRRRRSNGLIAQLAQECESGREGAGFACAALAQLIFLNILRAHLAKGDDLGVGWLRVLVDRRLAPALRLIHGEPSRNWHLPELAKAAAMSRTGFATRFKALSGMAPLAYLAQWRLRLAQRWLAEGEMSIGRIARATGFASDAAFSNAFKRLTGEAPSLFCRRVALTDTQ
jgi:AraC-like DNA-binding protein